MTLPSCQDINVYDSLDERWACKHFLGKTLVEAEALFRENPIYYQAGMMWMGVKAFRFYLPAAIQYIRSEESDLDFVDCFGGTLAFRLEHKPKELVPVAEQLVALCKYVIEHWSKLEDGVDVHGDIRTRYQILQQALLTMLA